MPLFCATPENLCATPWFCLGYGCAETAGLTRTGGRFI